MAHRRKSPCHRADGTLKKRWATWKAAEFVADYVTGKGRPLIWYQCPDEGSGRHWHTATDPTGRGTSLADLPQGAAA